MLADLKYKVAEKDGRVLAWSFFAALLMILQAALLWMDHHPMFFLGDSASYIWTALSGWLPTDRSFFYGYFIRLVSVTTGSLTTLVIAQVMLLCVASAVMAHLLIRYFRVRPWIAFAAALLTSVEPGQALYARYALTETLALSAFVFYIWLVLHYLEAPRIKWLCLAQVLALLLISIRFAFIPIVWVAAFALPLLAWRAIAGNERMRDVKTMARVALHVVLSAFTLFVLTSAYQHLHGHLQQKPPAYSYDGGFFAMGYVMPILEANDFADPILGAQVLTDLRFPAFDRHARGGHRWMEGGAVSRLKMIEPDHLKANAIAGQAAVCAIVHKPLAFLYLGWQTLTDYMKTDRLQGCMKADVGVSRLDQGFYNLIKTRFLYPSDQSSSLELQSLTGRYFLRSASWLQLLLFLPLGWGLLFLLTRGTDLRCKMLMLGLFALMIVGVAVFLVERPTPRYLHANGWLFFMLAAVSLHRFLPDGKLKNARVSQSLSGWEWLKNFTQRGLGNLPIRDLWFWGVIIGLILIILWIKHVGLYDPAGAMCFNDEFLYKRNASDFFSGLRIQHAHYPPLYSLAIAPAFLFSNWYDAIILINGILSTLLAVPIWFLARHYLDPRQAAVVVLLSLMIPFQWVYPSLIMSENLFLMIFAFAVLGSVKGANAGKLNAVFFGVMLALGCLTRYLMLPAVVILAVFWITMPFLTHRRAQDALSIRAILPNLLLMAFCFAVVYAPWLIYTHQLDIPLKKAMGFGISGLRPPHEYFADATLWLSAYGAYLVLACSPVLMPIMLGISTFATRKIRLCGLSRETVFAWLLASLTCCYWLLATNHSFSAWYNVTQPTYLIGRYLMFLTPLYLLAGVLSLDRLLGAANMVKRSHISVCVVLTLLFVLVARWILHGQGIWSLPEWFANIEFNSPDAFAYRNPILQVVALVGMLALGGIFWARQKQHRMNLFFGACVVLLVWQAALAATAIGRLPINLQGLHARKLAPVLLAQVSKHQMTLDLYYDAPAVDKTTMRRALNFWGMTIEPERLHTINPQEAMDAPRKPFNLLMRQKLALPAILSYTVGQETFYLYKINEQHQPRPPEILQVGPEQIVAGCAFNQQQDGSSALWLKTANATGWTIVVFNGRDLSADVQGSDLVTVLVPDDLFAEPGDIEVYLKDRLTGHVSAPIKIKVSSEQALR